MKKYKEILKLIYNLITGKEQILHIEEKPTDILEICDKNSPINIPPEVYKKICKELKAEDIKFMGIT